MRSTYLFWLSLLATLSNWMAAPCSAAQPNIVLIMADDLGWADTSNPLTTMGQPSDFYETPALDRLAHEGMAFTNAYTNGTNCAPTRAAILSGQWAQRPTNRVYQVGSTNRGGKSALLVGPPQGVDGDDAIPASTYTYAEHLRDNAGYATAHFGKFHVATEPAAITRDHGFEKNFGGGPFGAPTTYQSSAGQFGPHIEPELDKYATPYTQAYVDQNIKPYSTAIDTALVDALVGSNKHVSDAMTDAAIDFMKQQTAKPFVVQFHPYAVHTPIGNKQARPDLLKKYLSKTPGEHDSNASFAALIEGLDQNVARLVAYLKTTDDPRNPGQKLADNTLLLFYSDNGGKLQQSNNGPLKGEKGELDEGGIRVPLVAWSANPKLVAPGIVNSTPVYGIDFYPTFSKLAGVDLPNNTQLDGADLSAMLADPSHELAREALYWHLPAYLIGGGRDQHPQSVVRAGDWKLIYSYEDQTYELYNLKSDIGEQHNLAKSRPEQVQRLGDMLLNWLAETNAPLPTLASGTMTVSVTGQAYLDGNVVTLDKPLELSAGDQVPLVVPGD
ncbi:sulfatase [Aeoliella mucimassa]|uniref:Arylsulfatase n=1 Tax=Aeoliella mucimassa TaxID=2527972 RepID=A0A518AGR2_9BACT|nr:sulfatase [Aeoliella mucimassa]QDU53921.1 Arylsulfatase [Aeoliella mucimassa]